MTNSLVTSAPITNVEAIAATLDAAVSEATLKAYRTAQKQWSAFCGERGWDLYPAQATDAPEYVGHVLSWLQTLADAGRSTSTLTKLVSGIKFFASRESQLGFMILSSSPEIKKFAQAQSRLQRDVPVRQAKALTLPELKRVHKALPPTTAKNIRNRALIALGIAAALRSQSLADLDVGDVTKATGVDGITVTLRHSKTDQQGKGRRITVLRSSKRNTDAVGAVLAWVDYLRSVGMAEPSMPLFPAVRGRGVQAERMGNAADVVSHVVRGALVAAGVTDEAGAQAYSSHSLRSTFVTLSQQAGVSEADIAAITGHVNMATLRGYDRTSHEQHAQLAYLGE